MRERRRMRIQFLDHAPWFGSCPTTRYLRQSDVVAVINNYATDAMETIGEGQVNAAAVVAILKHLADRLDQVGDGF